MNWYLLQCKPNQQSRAQEHLSNQGFVTYAPVIRAERVIRRRRVVRTEPVFPGYVFIQLSEESPWRSLHATRGVSRLVSFNGYPHPVPVDLITALQSHYDESEKAQALYHEGDKVVITEGCFRHLHAIVKAVRPDDRVVVLLNILQGQQALALDVTQLARAS